MTTTTPPGWYPEPGHTGNGPAMERWWDGSAWTEYTRTAPVAPTAQPGVQPGVQPGYAYPYPSGPSGDIVASPGGGGRRPGTVAIAIMAALVLIGAVVAGILVLGKGSSKKDDAKNTPSPAISAPHRKGGGGQPAPQPSGGTQSPGSGGGKAVDGYDGISLPVLDGWTGATGQNGIGANVTTGGYPCPGDPSQPCVRGGVFAEPAAAAKITATSPEAAAKADIAPNAADSYSTDIYGATTSHQQVASQAVTVAGQQGYMVRWRITTKSGTSGYVESLVFPSPSNSSKLVLVRFGFDIGGQAPGVDVMDRITQGIKADSSGSQGGTSGGPTV